MHENKNKFLSAVLFILYLVFFVSLIFSFRAISSISIPLILTTGLIKNKTEKGSFFNPRLKNPLIIFCCLLFSLQLISLSHTNEIHLAWRNMFLNSLIIIVPLSLFCCDYIDETTRQKILKWYCIFLCTACLFAIYIAFRNFLTTHNYSVFVYHSLVSIYSGHAIQFSILVFIAEVHLLELLKRNEIFLKKNVHFFLILFFLLFLLLLSSKLVISFFILYFFFVVLRSYRLKSFSRAFILSSTFYYLFLTLPAASPNFGASRCHQILKKPAILLCLSLHLH